MRCSRRSCASRASFRLKSGRRWKRIPSRVRNSFKNVSHLNDLVAVIRNHHENWDGTGYPDGLRGEEIPLLSRIIMIADTVDAMTTDRPYRAAMGEAEVRAELLRLSGKQFDPVMCEKLLASTLYPSCSNAKRRRRLARFICSADEASGFERRPVRKKQPLRQAAQALVRSPSRLDASGSVFAKVGGASILRSPEHVRSSYQRASARNLGKGDCSRRSYCA